MDNGSEATPDEGGTDEVRLVVCGEGRPGATTEKQRRHDEAADHGERMLQPEDEGEENR